MKVTQLVLFIISSCHGPTLAARQTPRSSFSKAPTSRNQPTMTPSDCAGPWRSGAVTRDPKNRLKSVLCNWVQQVACLQVVARGKNNMAGKYRAVCDQVGFPQQLSVTKAVHPSNSRLNQTVKALPVQGHSRCFTPQEVQPTQTNQTNKKNKQTAGP